MNINNKLKIHAVDKPTVFMANLEDFISFPSEALSDIVTYLMNLEATAGVLVW